MMSHSGVSRRAAAAGLLASALLAGCGSGASTSVTTTTVAPRAAEPDAVPGDLRLVVFDRLPARFIEEPTGSALDGPLGLVGTAEALDDQETSTQEALLQQYGFISAYQRAWLVEGTRQLLIIRVQVMGSPAQAAAYFNLLNVADRASGQFGSFPTPRLAEASGFTHTYDDSSGREVSQDISLVRGRLFYHLIFTGPKGTVPAGDVLGVAVSQSNEAADLGYN
jgi:hypothetical protein